MSHVTDPPKWPIGSQGARTHVHKSSSLKQLRHEPGWRPVSSEPELPAGAAGPVTATVTRRVKPGHEDAYEEFLAGISGAAKGFPGYLGEEVFRPASGQGGEYRIVYRFDSPAHLRGWLDSEERAAWLARAEPHVAGPMRAQFLTGLEGWFTLPAQPGAPPPPYKMAVLTWVTIFPLITLVVVVSAPLIGPWPLAARLAVTTLVTVSLMTWVVMPRVTALLRRWLYPGRRR
jgi:antibiotic biosynthesis monooxygenase (ABM) superfamily enzyme